MEMKLPLIRKCPCAKKLMEYNGAGSVVGEGGILRNQRGGGEKEQVSESFVRHGRYRGMNRVKEYGKGGETSAAFVSGKRKLESRKG